MEKNNSQIHKMEKNNYRDWLDLPPELMESILQRIGWCDVLMSAKNVCKSWHNICKGLSAWHVIKILQTNTYCFGTQWGLQKTRIFFGENLIEINCDAKGIKLATRLAMHVLDLSSGQLLDLCIHRFGSNHLLESISHGSSQLRSLRLQHCCVYPNDQKEDEKESHGFYISAEGLTQMLRNLPLLEELQFLYTSTIPIKCIEVAGRRCPRLKSFTLNERIYDDPRYRSRESNAHALAIVRNMSRLHHSQLLGNRMTVRGLKAILNHCHHLEYLDLRQCYNLGKALKEASLERRLLRQIKHVRFPEDSTEDCEFDAKIYD